MRSPGPCPGESSRSCTWGLVLRAVEVRSQPGWSHGGGERSPKVEAEMGNPQGHAPLGASEEKLSAKGQCQGTKGRSPRCSFTFRPCMDRCRQWPCEVCSQSAREQEGHRHQQTPGLEDTGGGRCALPWPSETQSTPTPIQGAPCHPQGSAKD